MSVKNAGMQGASQRGGVESANASRENHTIKLADGEYRRLPEFEVGQNAEGSVLKDRSASQLNFGTSKKADETKLDDVKGSLKGTETAMLAANAVRDAVSHHNKGAILDAVALGTELGHAIVSKMMRPGSMLETVQNGRDLASTIEGLRQLKKDGLLPVEFNENSIKEANALALYILNNPQKIEILGEKEDVLKALLEGLVSLKVLAKVMENFQNIGTFQRNYAELRAVLEDVESAFVIIGDELGKSKFEYVMGLFGTALSVAANVARVVANPTAPETAKAAFGVISRFSSLIQSSNPDPEIWSTPGIFDGNREDLAYFGLGELTDEQVAAFSKWQHLAVYVLKNKDYETLHNVKKLASELNYALNLIDGVTINSLSNAKGASELMKVCQDIESALRIVNENLKNAELASCVDAAKAGVALITSGVGLATASSGILPIGLATVGVLNAFIDAVKFGRELYQKR